VVTSDDQAAADRQALLSVRHLGKRFGAITAIDDVNLNVYEAETLGIVGDNGAGKSTLLSLLTGYNQPDSGGLYYRGRRVTVSSPARARRDLSIEMIYQDLAMAPDLTVWQNMFLGEERKRFGLFLDSRAMKANAVEALARMHTKIRPTDLVGQLSGGERQLVAVARALLFDRDIVLMDEPTASISVSKVEDLLQMIEGLRHQGKTVILVSHRLEDILRVCTRIAVLVMGRLQEVVDNDNLSVEDLVHMMFGSRSEGHQP
jgi:simple sugar transport system ATP-binding protein